MGRRRRRLLTLAAIYDGATRTETPKIDGVGFRSSDWVLPLAVYIFVDLRDRHRGG